MSDLFRDTCIEAYVGFGVHRLRAPRAGSREPRQTAAEYMGVLLVVSVIIAGVAQTHIGDQIVERMKSLIDDSPAGKNGTD